MTVENNASRIGASAILEWMFRFQVTGLDEAVTTVSDFIQVTGVHKISRVFRVFRITS